MTNQLAERNIAAEIERVIIGGDLSKLTPEQRVNYYMQVCNSIGLNYLTKPFEYITLNGKLTLYARKDATDQLRRNNNISIHKPDIQFQDDWIIVTVSAGTNDGRTDSDIGVVNKKDMSANFGNALMKAVTKAKRRVTLSICGLGMLDETEIDTIPNARPVNVAETGEIIDPEVSQPATAAPTAPETETSIPKERPYPPAALKRVIEIKAATHKTNKKTITDGARGLMVSLLEGLFDGDADSKANQRHQLCVYLTGSGSSKTMPAEYANALLDWMQYDQSIAAKEAQAAVTAMAVEAGQESLF